MTATKGSHATTKDHRPMPKDPRQLAKAMFKAADKKTEEKRAAGKPATQER